MPDIVALWITLIPTALMTNRLMIRDLTDNLAGIFPPLPKPAQEEKVESKTCPSFIQKIYIVGTGPLPDPMADGTFKVPDGLEDLTIFCDLMCRFKEVENPMAWIRYLLDKYGAPKDSKTEEQVKQIMSFGQMVEQFYEDQGKDEGKLIGMNKGKSEMAFDMVLSMIRNHISKETIIKILTGSHLTEQEAENLYESVLAADKQKE